MGPEEQTAYLGRKRRKRKRRDGFGKGVRSSRAAAGLVSADTELPVRVLARFGLTPDGLFSLRGSPVPI